MAIRKAKTQWTGKLAQGSNQEELLCAAHAVCFSMALAHALKEHLKKTKPKH